MLCFFFRLLDRIVRPPAIAMCHHREVNAISKTIGNRLYAATSIRFVFGTRLRSDQGHPLCVYTGHGCRWHRRGTRQTSGVWRNRFLRAGAWSVIGLAFRGVDRAESLPPVRRNSPRGIFPYSSAPARGVISSVFRRQMTFDGWRQSSVPVGP